VYRKTVEEIAEMLTNLDPKDCGRTHISAELPLIYATGLRDHKYTARLLPYLTPPPPPG
jgi:hypothetical protein